ncbi:MAG: hypothetical protein IT424_05990 [Pirellulales bacterium]|nr:hypothetical protein [Pirellulales bacterium]
MMELATWVAVLVLGPGSMAIFVWFLFSLRDALDGEDEQGRERRDAG